MKHSFLTLLFTYAITVVIAQDAHIDSLKKALYRSREDTSKINLYSEISRYYNYKYPDSVLHYGFIGLAIAKRLSFKKGEIDILTNIGEAFSTKGNFPKAMEIKLQAMKEAEKLNDSYLISSCQNYLGALYIKIEDYQKALLYYHTAKANQTYFNNFKKYLFGMIGRCHLFSNHLDSAYYYINQSYQLDVRDREHWSIPYYSMAIIYEKEGKYAQALDLYKAGNEVVSIGALDIFNGYKGMASVFKKMNRPDSALYYSKMVVEGGLKRSHYTAVFDASTLLTDIYKSNHAIDSAFKYQEIMLASKDTLFSQDKVKLILNLTFNEQQRHQQLEQAKKEARQQYEAKVTLYGLLIGLAILSLIAFILYNNNRQKQQSNYLLEKQKKEIQLQRDNLEQTLLELRAAEDQLVQRDKMASLGELTAGIAHEIQNPLNFGNNFSEVSVELVDDLKKEASEGNDAEVIAIADDIASNLQKVVQHGKRADAIVKGMLQHSRASTGQKEPTDINALADEYLRLSYHGLRAKDKEFDASIETHFDENLCKIEVIPQDIGRVLLNLFSNAFYAVNEKKKQLNGTFAPAVSVTTAKESNKIIISVRDNGAGIPDKATDKIFRPFFTTKPTGQGTGLGLSLAYDIIKAHGGDLKVNSTEGKGAEFIIQLPNN